MFGFGKKDDPLEIIEEIEELFAEGDGLNPRVEELYHQVRQQGWYLTEDGHGGWMWRQDEES